MSADSIFTAPADPTLGTDRLANQSTRHHGRPDPADLVTFVHLQPGEVIATCGGVVGVGRSEEAALWALGERLFADS